MTPWIDNVEHAPTCLGAEYEWQQQIWPGLAARGRCLNCGAVTFDRSGQTTKIIGDAEPRRRRNGRKER
jgi:hypothetical protein